MYTISFVYVTTFLAPARRTRWLLTFQSTIAISSIALKIQAFRAVQIKAVIKHR